MSIQRPSEYYDDIYSREEYKQKYLCNFSESPYFELWKKILPLIPKEIAITDIGCGTGQFAHMILESGYKYLHGFDFSRFAIDQAKKLYTPKLFSVGDATSGPINGEFFVALEIFEHTKDFKIIENIGLGKEIVFTVPDFDDASHVRYFRSITEVVDRYRNYIKFDHIEKFQHWFICKGVTI